MILEVCEVVVIPKRNTYLYSKRAFGLRGTYFRGQHPMMIGLFKPLNFLKVAMIQHAVGFLKCLSNQKVRVMDACRVQLSLLQYIAFDDSDDMN